MAYSMLCKLHVRNLITPDQMGALLTAAVCHDVDHPGLNNSYHCHAHTPLAILYNYQSILGEYYVVSDMVKRYCAQVTDPA